MAWRGVAALSARVAAAVARLNLTARSRFGSRGGGLSPSQSVVDQRLRAIGPLVFSMRSGYVALGWQVSSGVCLFFES